MAPKTQGHIGDKVSDLTDQCFVVKQYGVPNFLGARIPVLSQLNVDEWKCEFNDYWDRQLLQLIQFGFPLGFNRNCKLTSEGKKHFSAVEFPSDIQVYLNEEKHHGAILCPFSSSPILKPISHCMV